MFYCNEANVINKAKRDLAYRNPVNLYHDEGGNLIYEDDIYGKDSFIRWILSYGSSVRILEPQSLIDEFIEILSK
jgi:predicted DNA-binding transcriptional regulator YafY